MAVEATTAATVTPLSSAREAPLPSGLPVETVLSLFFFFFGGEASLPPSEGGADVGGRRGRRRVASEAGTTKLPQQEVALVKYSNRPRNPR